MIKRKENWQLELNKAVEAARERPFSWGEHDCCLFVADCIVAMTGVDPMAKFRGTYDSEDQAKRVLNDLGAKSLFRTLQTIFGQAMHSSKASRGDVVYRRNDGSPAVGVCLGDVSVFVGANVSSQSSKDGLVVVKTISCLKAFRV